MFRQQSALKYIRVPCAVYQIFGKFNKLQMERNIVSVLLIISLVNLNEEICGGLMKL